MAVASEAACDAVLSVSEEVEVMAATQRPPLSD